MADQQEVPAADPTRNELAKLPLWHGIASKDTFSPLQWIERVETAKEACEWTDKHTMAFIYMALRNNALQWYDGLKRDGVDKQNYQQFKNAFLMAYAPAQTARTAIINIHELRQGPNESVVNYKTRVVTAADYMEALLPPEARAPTDNRYAPKNNGYSSISSHGCCNQRRDSKKVHGGWSNQNAQSPSPADFCGRTQNSSYG